MKIEIEKAEKTRIDEVSFDNMPFGRYMSDHMFICQYRDGAWQTPRIVPYRPLELAPSCKVFHYGQAIFEGMKAFKDAQGRVFLFRPSDNQERFNRSAVRMNMPEFPAETFLEAVQTLLRLDRDWIPQGVGQSYYIRPFMIATEPALNAVPSKEYQMMIIGGPVDTIFHGQVKVKIADHFSRAANGGTGFAKCAGNYGGQFYPSTLAAEEGYQSVVWTDDATHQYLEEAGQMNFMLRIGDTLRTAPVSERLLDGITRRSCIQLLKDWGYEVEERRISAEELFQAAKDGTLEEAWGTGTAAVVSPIGELAEGDEKAIINHNEIGPVTQKLYDTLTGIQWGRVPDPHGWIMKL